MRNHRNASSILALLGFSAIVALLSFLLPNANSWTLSICGWTNNPSLLPKYFHSSSMSSLQTNIKEERELIPTSVTPRCYDLILTPDLTSLAYQGEVAIEYVPFTDYI